MGDNVNGAIIALIVAAVVLFGSTVGLLIMYLLK